MLLDRPNGKLDPRKSVTACAAQELEEEIVAVDLVQGKLLGTTAYGYRQSGFFEVNTTDWYALHPSLCSLLPDWKRD